jgi:hypothetical protein
MDLIIVKTANVCHICGVDALELVEDEQYVWFGCKRCMRYVRREKRQIVKMFVDYRGRRFNWSNMMAELYRLYTK